MNKRLLNLLTYVGLFIISLVVIFIPVPWFVKVAILVLFFGGAIFLDLKVFAGMGQEKAEIPSGDTEEQQLEDTVSEESLVADSVLESTEPKETELEAAQIQEYGLESQVEASDTIRHLVELIDSSRTKILPVNGLSLPEGMDSSLQILTSLKGDSRFIQENVKRAFDISDNLANTAQEAFELSEKVQKGVKIVTSALSDSMSHVSTLYEQSQKISKILSLMSDISSKTHVLSINASIVSARAGIKGKGFEVVAKEIRKLAVETEESLSEIETLITDIQDSISEVTNKVQVANDETKKEETALMSVGGALQGVILAVEIIRTVTNVAKGKSSDQGEEINNLSTMFSQVSDVFSSIKENCNSISEVQSVLDEMKAILSDIGDSKL